MVVRKECDDCKQPIFILRTLSGANWPFNQAFFDANLVPSRQSWDIRRSGGQTIVALLDGAPAPDGKVLTRHFCEEGRARYQDIEGCANLLRPLEQLVGA